MNGPLVAPFPYFGGKRMVAPIIWRALGDVASYVEPFAGSAAVLLARPNNHAGGTETINDSDGMVSNFWRAVKGDPEAVAYHADWPVIECDLHARHAWLVGQRESLTARLEGNPDFYDAKVAGWWVWGCCAWIGSGWCSGRGPWGIAEDEGHKVLARLGGAGLGVKRQLPHLSNAGQGINRNLPHLGAGQGINRKLPHLGNAGRGINRKLPHLGAGQGINRNLPHLGDAGRGAFIADWVARLSDRLRGVRVASGDWRRIVTPAVLWANARGKESVTGVLLDPPYTLDRRTANIYTHDTDIAENVTQWARENGDCPALRIALCGYDITDMPPGWTAHRWKSAGGYGSQGNGTQGAKNRDREVIWFSPHCHRPDATMPLFDTSLIQGTA